MIQVGCQGHKFISKFTSYQPHDPLVAFSSGPAAEYKQQAGACTSDVNHLEARRIPDSHVA